MDIHRKLRAHSRTAYIYHSKKGSDMQIYGFNKTTLLDFPGRIAATVFTGGCNFRCPFCHNGGLVLAPEEQPEVPEDEVLAFLKKRKGILTGVCITGGEPTLRRDLPEFIVKVRELGLAVKLDTNGYCPQALEQLLSEGLLDYAAMDIKAGKDNYARVCGLPSVDFTSIEHSVSLIKNSGIAHEFRTTVVRELHCLRDFLQIGPLLQGACAYYLQSYTETEEVLEPGFHSYEREELLAFAEAVKPFVPNTQLRGVE